MIHVVTGLQRGTSDIMLCKLSPELLNTTKHDITKLQEIYRYTLYYKNDTTKSPYSSFNNHQFVHSANNKNEMNMVQKMVQEIVSKQQEDTTDIVVLPVAISDQRLHNTVLRLLTNQLRSTTPNIKPLDLIKYFDVTSFDKLVDILKTRLNTKNIFANDPITVAYAIYVYMIER